jgi:hypothetical protein
VYTLYLSKGTAKVTGYEGNPKSVTIESDINGFTVNSIGDDAFSECTTLRSVSIPTSVTVIGEMAFCECTSLRSVIIPSSVEEIGESAFMDCTSLNSVTLNAGLEFIGNAAFYHCSIESITLPYTINDMGECVFQRCTSLKSVNMENGSVFGESAFKGCTALTTINIPSSTKTIPVDAFSECSSLSTVTLPYGLTEIGGGAFADCTSLCNINIPSSVKSIGVSAFGWCSSLTKISIPSSVEEIGSTVFIKCDSLTEITIPSSVSSVGNYAFDKCSKLSLAKFLGDAPENFGKEVFRNCASSFKINYIEGKSGWTTPTWNGYKAYPISEASITEVPNPPSFKVKGIFGGRQVMFNCETGDATIYYTTESRSALKLTDPCVSPGETVTFNAYYGTIYARAYLNGKWSNVSRLVLKIPTVNTPTITKLSGNKVKIKTTTPSSIVYYTTDGSTPSATNFAGRFWCSHDVIVPSGRTIKAVAVRTCFSDSSITTYYS